MSTKLTKVMWNKMTPEQRFSLLSRCSSIVSMETKSYEARMKWDKLMPVTQNDLLKGDLDERV